MSETHTHAWGTQPEMFGPRHEHRLAMFTRETANLARGSRILDAAVGLGQLGSRLRAQGHRVFGIDTSLDAVLHAKRRYGIPAVIGDLTKLPFRDEVFDAVTSGETLEHLDDDASAAQEIGRIVRERGKVFVTVPALESLWTASDDYYEHRRRYTSRQLSSLFRSAMFDVQRSSYWGFPIVLIYDTLFLLPMNKRRARMKIAEDRTLQTVASAGARGWLVRAVRAVFALDNLFRLIPYGPGLFLIAEKRRPGTRLPTGSKSASQWAHDRT